jgi:hypothetical protein
MMPANFADELKKLEALRWNGTLTDAEFERAKAALFAQLPTDDVSKLEAELAELRAENELARIDREWDAEREQYLLRDKCGNKQVPTVNGSIVLSAVAAVFGVFWTVFTVSITNRGPDFGAFSVAKVLFPLVGITITIVAVVMGFWGANKAKEYEKAHAAYQARRAAVKRGG